jgi:hypothetical protein
MRTAKEEERNKRTGKEKEGNRGQKKRRKGIQGQGRGKEYEYRKRIVLYSNLKSHNTI